MKITLTTPISIDWTDPMSGAVSQKSITKLEITFIDLDYRSNVIKITALYKDDSTFGVSANHSAMGSNAIDLLIAGSDYTTLEAAGINQSALYTYLQNEYAFLAGSVA